MIATVQWRGDWLEVRRDGHWEYVARVANRGAAVILATTAADEIVLVEQHRPALNASTIELPAGLIGDTDAADTPFAAAQRELAEETGFGGGDWADTGEFATSPGMSAETFHLFRARGVVRHGAGGGVEGEAITVHVVALTALAAFLAGQRRAGRVIDCRLVAAMGLV